MKRRLDDKLCFLFSSGFPSGHFRRLTCPTLPQANTANMQFNQILLAASIALPAIAAPVPIRDSSSPSTTHITSPPC